MEIIAIILLTVILAVLVFMLLGSKKPAKEHGMLMLQQDIDNLRKQLSDSLKNNTDLVNNQLTGIRDEVHKQLGSVSNQMISSQQNMNERLDNAAKVFSEVQKGIGSLNKATEQVFAVGKDIASLQEILKAPKLRGTLGELFLGDLLSQMLPSSNYSLQYKFRTGEMVDAVVRLGSGMVPVDAKFPLENFKRIVETQDDAEAKTAKKKFISDVKKHIDSIASKYILPDEGTFDFALMYIPAENVYYETIIKEEDSEGNNILATYAMAKKVIPVSPNSFYAYLQAIVLGLRGMKIEKSAQEIIQHLARLKGDFNRFTDEFDVLGKHITNIKNKYDDASKRLGRLGNKLLSSDEEACKEEKIKQLNN